MKKKILNVILTVLIVVFATLSVLLLASRIFYDTNDVIVGSSMYPTLTEGDVAVVKKIKYVQSIKLGDIIVYEHEEKEVVKRVIGVPGDHVTINNVGMVYVNDVQLDESEYLGESYITATRTHGVSAYFDVTLGENEYYTLGDNREVSYDSRFYGAVDYSSITGKLRMIYAHATKKDSSSDEFTSRRFISWRFY